MTISLEQQLPPRKGAKAGFYPDPLSTGRARWWDGSAWTPRMGPKVGPDAPKGKPVPPPTKVCRHCGAQSETMSSSCPNCGKGYERNTGLIIGIVASVVVVLLFFGGCAILFAALIEEADEIDPSNSISRAEFDAVPLGSTRAQVVARLGRPYETKSVIGAAGPVTCTDYNEEGEGLFQDERFRLCFRDGILFTKRAAP